jgi:hypothetical protein
MIKSSSRCQLVEDMVGILKPAKIIFWRTSTADIHFTGDYSFEKHEDAVMVNRREGEGEGRGQRRALSSSTNTPRCSLISAYWSRFLAQAGSLRQSRTA